MSLCFRRLRGCIELKLDVRFAGRVGVVMEDGAKNDFIAHIAKTRQGRFDHQRLVNLDCRLSGPELVLTGRGDRNDSVPSEAIGSAELGVDMTLSVCPQSCVPKGAGEEILAQTIERRR